MITPVFLYLLSVASNKIGMIFVQFSVHIEKIIVFVHSYVRTVCYDTVAC